MICNTVATPDKAEEKLDEVAALLSKDNFPLS